MSSISDRFIARTLQSAGERMLARQKEAILTEVTERTGNLRLGRTVTVISGQDGGTMIFEHRIYERFLDIRKPGTGKAKTKIRRIHNRFVMGMYNNVAYRLLHGFTDEVQAAMAEDIRRVASLGTITFGDGPQK